MNRVHFARAVGCVAAVVGSPCAAFFFALEKWKTGLAIVGGLASVIVAAAIAARWPTWKAIWGQGNAGVWIPWRIWRLVPTEVVFVVGCYVAACSLMLAEKSTIYYSPSDHYCSVCGNPATIRYGYYTESRFFRGDAARSETPTQVHWFCGRCPVPKTIPDQNIDLDSKRGAYWERLIINAIALAVLSVSVIFLYCAWYEKQERRPVILVCALLLVWPLVWTSSAATFIACILAIVFGSPTAWIAVLVVGSAVVRAFSE